MTEADVQDALFRYCNTRRHQPIVPNCHVLGHEADLLSLTKAGLVHEFEVKVSRADYKADLDGSLTKWLKHEKLAGRYPVFHKWTKDRLQSPNYFWYATPEGLLEDLELPEYAGHLEVKPNLWGDLQAHVIKTAPRLHRERPNQEQIIWMAGSLQMKYWRERLKAA